MAIVKRKKKINELKFNLTHGAVPQVHIEDIMQQACFKQISGLVSNTYLSSNSSCHRSIKFRKQAANRI